MASWGLAITGCAVGPASYQSCGQMQPAAGAVLGDPLAADFANALHHLIVGTEYPQSAAANQPSDSHAHRDSRHPRTVEQAASVQAVAADLPPNPAIMPAAPQPEWVPSPIAGVNEYHSPPTSQPRGDGGTGEPAAGVAPPYADEMGGLPCGPPPRFFPVPVRPAFSSSPTSSWQR